MSSEAIQTPQIRRHPPPLPRAVSSGLHLDGSDRKYKAIDAHNCFKDVRDIIGNFNLDQFIDWFYSTTYDSFQPWMDGSAHHNSRNIPIALLIPESGIES